ncbi:hypothetical protein [Hyalangium gracile]|uniref:hypothetical protein n=1 Tax=Hyalangium gracile TaxID=394092 RepID=UPI001CCBA7D6|nr:hypothetical protein [Hyalangium gracile]
MAPAPISKRLPPPPPPPPPLRPPPPPQPVVTAAVSRAKVASGLKLSSAKVRTPAPSRAPLRNAVDSFAAAPAPLRRPPPGRVATAKAPEYTPTLYPLSRGIGDAFTASTKSWGTLTGKAGLTPNLRKLPQHVVSTNLEVARGPLKAQFDAWRADLEKKVGKTFSDLDVNPRNYTVKGNLARYQNRTVHLFVPKEGVRLNGPDGSRTGTGKEVDSGRNTIPSGPGVETVDGERKFRALTGSGPNMPTPPDRLREGVERGGAALNGAGFLFSAANALTNAPRQAGDTVDSLKRGDIAGAVNSGSQVAKHAATLVATGGQLIEDAGKYLPKVVPPSVAKAAGRFVPGANVAIAALDTAQAVKSWSNPNASTGKKVGDTITAAGSIIAALPLPGANFVGGAVATASSLLTGWLFPT